MLLVLDLLLLVFEVVFVVVFLVVFVLVNLVFSATPTEGEETGLKGEEEDETEFKGEEELKEEEEVEGGVNGNKLCKWLLTLKLLLIPLMRLDSTRILLDMSFVTRGMGKLLYGCKIINKGLELS
jgi:hypothetical protein